MLPVPSTNAILIFVGGVLMLAVALVLRSAETAVLAGSMLLGLGATLSLTTPLGARLRRERLEFAWWHAHDESGAAGGAVVTGAPFHIRCTLRNRSQRELRFVDAAPVIPDHLEPHEAAPGDLVIPPRSMVEFELDFVARSSGRAVLQGLAVTVPGPFSLFAAPLYFAIPLGIKVLPKAALRSPALAMAATGLPVERAGATLLRHPGSGTEFREIRELVPGDPFKNIAWKVSARRGKLMVREVENEVQETLMVVQDVSGSMRGGEPGARKLDFCMEVTALAARTALQRGDRVGLACVDGRIVTQLGPREGLGQMIPLYDTLQRAVDTVDEDLTDLHDEDLCARLGRYLRFQDGEDFRRGDAWDVEAMARHASRVLQTDAEQHPVVAHTREMRLLRRLCRFRGLPLPYRAESPPGRKVQGLAHALRWSAGTGRMPRSLLLITDFDTAEDMAELERSLRMLRLRGHSVLCLFADGRSLGETPVEELERDLHAIYGLAEERRFRAARQSLGRMGVRTLGTQAQESPARVVARIHSAQRAA